MDLNAPIFKTIYKVVVYITIAFGVVFVAAMVRFFVLITEYSYARHAWFTQGGSRDRIYDLNLALSLTSGWMAISLLLAFFLTIALITYKSAGFITKATKG